MLVVGAAGAQSPPARQSIKPDLATRARTFRVWVFSDAHVGSDLNLGRESLAIPLSQSEGPRDSIGISRLTSVTSPVHRERPKTSKVRRLTSNYRSRFTCLASNGVRCHVGSAPGRI